MASKEVWEILTWTDTPMDIFEITNETQLLYMISEIEKVVRRSIEYRGWVTSKKYKHEQTICKAYDIDVTDYKGVRIEQDHFPVSLWDIVWIIGTKMISELDNGTYLTTFDIASQVMREHLDDQHIGSISLLTSFHELRHAGVHKVKVSDIHGDYQSFLDKYEGYIPEAVQDRIRENLIIEKED